MTQWAKLTFTKLAVLDQVQTIQFNESLEQCVFGYEWSVLTGGKPVETEVVFRGLPGLMEEVKSLADEFPFISFEAVLAGTGVFKVQNSEVRFSFFQN